MRPSKYPMRYFDRKFRHNKSRITLVKGAKTINDLFSSLAGTYARLSFLQFGLRVSRRGNSSLRKEKWKLNSFRTVQYVQTEEQKKSLEFVLERRRKSRERADLQRANSFRTTTKGETVAKAVPFATLKRQRLTRCFFGPDL